MSKALYIDPKEIRKAGEIKLPTIPVMQYKKSIDEELSEGNFTKEDLLRIYRDMFTIREFETMLNLVKTTGGYNGVPYNNPGPAHLSIGQEASAVGQAYCLDINDFTFGSHRSHGEILAKGLRSIQILSDAELTKVMEEFWGGATLAVARKDYKGNDVKELGIRFLLYGAIAEIFARETGFNKGLGGSMHTFFIPFGIFSSSAKLNCVRRMPLSCERRMVAATSSTARCGLKSGSSAFCTGAPCGLSVAAAGPAHATSVDFGIAVNASSPIR